MNFDTTKLDIVKLRVPERVTVVALDEKRISKKYQNKQDIEKQKYAKKITDELNSVKNKLYKVPEIYKIDEKNLETIEERFYGMPLSSELFNSMNSETQDYICNALAHFCNDINQLKPILTQDKLFNKNNKNLYGLDIITEKLKGFISEKDLSKINAAKEWFYTESKNASSIVFSQADFHKNNILYNPKTKDLIILDFADSKYEEVNEMLSNMSLLYSDKIAKIYKSLPRNKPVNFDKNPDIDKLRTRFRNFQISATEFISNNNTENMKNLIEDIKNISSSFDFINGINKIKNQKANIALNKIQNNFNYNSVNGQRGRGATGVRTILPAK